MNQEGWSFANGPVMFYLLLKNKLINLSFDIMGWGKLLLDT